MIDTLMDNGWKRKRFWREGLRLSKGDGDGMGFPEVLLVSGGLG